MGSMMRNVHLRSACAVLLALFAAAAPAGAQEATVYATGTVDGNSTGIGLVGASVRGGGLGLQPVGVLQAYYLRYEIPGATAADDPEEVSLVGLQPQVGLAWYGVGGALEARVGYSLVSLGGEEGEGEDGDDAVLEGEVGGEGFTTSVQAQTWSTVPEVFGLASYNWGSSYLYTQGQAVLPLGGFGVGAELVWQQQMGDDDGDDFEYRSTSVGPLVRFGLGAESSLTLAGGYKDDNVRDPTWYARLTFVRWGLGF